MTHRTNPVITDEFCVMTQNGPTSASDLIEFKKACTPEEWQQFAVDAADALDEELEEAA